MRKSLFIIVILGLVFGIISPLFGMSSAYAETPKVKFQIDRVPYVTPAGEPDPFINKDNRTMVPIRFISTGLGVSDDQVKWDFDSKIATIKKDTTEIRIQLGSRYYMVNGTSLSMDTAAEMKNNRVFVPVKYIVEALDATTIWEARSSTVHIFSKNTDELYDLSQNDLGGIMNSAAFTVDKQKKKLLFNNEQGTTLNHELQENVNPKINSQIYELVKALAAENEYVDMFYSNMPGEERVVVKYGKNSAFTFSGSNYFDFIFYEKKPINSKKSSQFEGFSEKNVLFISLYNLWRDSPFEEGWINPFYENKFRLAMIAIFGEKDGVDIASYIIGEYLGARERNSIPNDSYFVKTIGNIQINFWKNNGSDLNFGFSYTK